LRVNGEAIYGTRKWEKAPPTTPQTTTRFTRKGADLFVIVTRWQDKPIVVEGISKTESVILLGYNGKVDHTVSGDNLTILPPPLSPANNPSAYAWVFKVSNAL